MAFDALLSRVATSRTKKETLAHKTEKPTVSELNPYWADGGTGMPENGASTAAATKPVLTSANESWLRRAYDRAREEAQSSDRSLRSILLDRWDEETVRAMEETFSHSRHSGNNRSPKDSRYHANKSRPRWKRDVSGQSNDPIRPRSHERSPERSRTDNLTASNLSMDRSHKPMSETINSQPVEATKEVEERFVNDDDINAAAAKLMKAELMGDENKTVKLRSNLEKLREAQRRGIKIRLTKTVHASHSERSSDDKVVHLTTLNRFGNEMPLHLRAQSSLPSAVRRPTECSRKETDSHYDHAPVSTVEEMLRDELLDSGRSSDRQFLAMAAKCHRGAEDEYDDAFLSKKALSQETVRYRQKTDAISDYKRKTFAESKCSVCMENTARHLIISVGQRVFLSIPEHASLTPGHCFIAPHEHIGAMTRVDEVAADEANAYKQKLCKLASRSLGLSHGSYVFLEVAAYPNAYKHHVRIECIPVDRDALEELPLYFKKALHELGSEWDQNKRVIQLRRPGFGARDSVPDNFGYFSVEFGHRGEGFVKVIEDWSSFPLYFGREVIGGFLDKSSELWRNPKREPLESLRRKIVHFEELWEPFESGLTLDLPPTETPDEGEPEGPVLPPSMCL
ncbi:unnamed protein product [Schistocephalus solidus]|uniref:CWF19-like protein 2 n=1 Tax=Schistocephalus solidus TaxID=70667 RepID=A0A3P7BRR3_SCHSO|nr:unnamed protein product [Schistocephalus solidus]